MFQDIQFEDFRLAILSLWNHKLLIIAFTLSGLFAGLLFTSVTNEEELYTSTATVYAATYGSYELTSSDLRTFVNYSDVISSDKVTEYAATLIKETRITADEIRASVRLYNDENSYVMSINAVHPDPNIVSLIANATTEAFVNEITSITGSNAIQVLDEANKIYLYNPVNLNKTRLIFVMGAFVIIAGFIGIKELFSNKVRSIIQCSEDDNEILGILPFVK